jgi:hypothetical protein
MMTLPGTRRNSRQDGQFFADQPGGLMQANERDKNKVKNEPGKTSPVWKGSHCGRIQVL